MKESSPDRLVQDIEIFSGESLKRKDDLSTLLKLGYANQKEDLIEELSFTSKYVQGLFRVLKQGTTNPEVQNIEQIKNDISANLEKVKDKIEQLLENSAEQTKKYFRENYLQLSQNNMLNLTELMNDLEWLKKYSNQLKRKKPN
jgi:ElaB/YqjD/DUF883 family membrane-anchored ribosome-binding protein